MNGIKNNLLPLIVTGLIALGASGVGGLIVNYGWSKAADEKMNYMNTNINKLESMTAILFKITTDNALTNVEQKEQISALKQRIESLERNKKK